jgi:hypothetical protein
MTIKSITYSLCRLISLKLAPKLVARRFAKADGTSMNQFFVMAVAEKLSAMHTADDFFAARKGRGDREAALRFLQRADGEPPRAEDQLTD